MSDSFADLWNSSTPTEPVPQSQKLGSVMTRNAFKPAQPDVFSLLSSAGSSNLSSRSMSPVVTGGTSQRTTQSSATKSLSNSGDDAFSNLLSGSLVTSTNDNARMTMAEKAAEAERQKLGNLNGHEQVIKSQPTSNVWDGLDSLAIMNTQPVPSSFSSKSQQALPVDDWALKAFTSQPASRAGPAESTSPPASTVTTEDDWLGEFANKSAFQLEPQAVSLSDQSKSPSLHGDFDVGNDQDTLFESHSNYEDDILGALSTIQSSSCQPASRNTSPLVSRDHERNITSSAGSQQDIREQTDKLITHASEIGMNMLNIVSSFWKEGKGRVHKAYVERTAVATGSSSGRPRWMTEQVSRIPADISASRTTSPPVHAAVRPPSPLRRRVRLVSASPSMLAAAYKHKEAGSAKFKLGQYVEAEGIYSLGIDALPSGHLLLLPLLNNRALARLRIGDYTGAVADAGAVIDSIGTGYHPQYEAKVAREEEGAGVDLGDALVKALKRRAEAYEGREKWKEAAKDWGVLAGLEWAEQKMRVEAARSVGRCRKMVAQTKGAEVTISKPLTSEPKPHMAVKPASLSRPAVPSQALENLRIVNHAAEAEDQLRHELKDSVDAKLLAWKGGKETNIRALLGSLDTVLWPELGLKKVGMAELVMPTQVKNKYTRTIAKLHPDKLNSGNTTVEQRMIANGVFGALNEAWNAFKQ